MSPLEMPMALAMIVLGLAGLALHAGYELGRRSRR